MRRAITNRGSLRMRMSGSESARQRVIPPSPSHGCCPHGYSGRRNAGAETKSVFAGLLKCTHCGGTVTRMPKGDDNVYLICSQANRRVGCKPQAVRYADVERALVENATMMIQEAPRGRETSDL